MRSELPSRNAAMRSLPGNLRLRFLRLDLLLPLVSARLRELRAHAELALDRFFTTHRIHISCLFEAEIWWRNKWRFRQGIDAGDDGERGKRHTAPPRQNPRYLSPAQRARVLSPSSINFQNSLRLLS